jgi:Uma2 family endonuclease
MPTAVTRKAPQNAAELLELIERLGGIDAARVRLKPPPGQATERDLLRAVESKAKSATCELVDGTLVEKSMGFEEDSLAAALVQILRNFVSERRLGAVTGSQGPFRLQRRNVRLPDVAFVSASKWRVWKRLRRPIADFGPDLAIEVVSRSNTRAELARKRRDYFASGTKLVWEVDPRRQTVTVYTGVRQGTRLSHRESLDGGDVLPGFKLRLSELFADPLA